MATKENKKKDKNVVIRTLRKPVIWNFLVRAALGSLLFIIAFNLSGTQFFYENPIFGVKFLAEILIGLAAFAFGFHTVPMLSIMFRDWFETFVSETVTDIVAEFWEQQTDRMASAREERQKKRDERAEEKRQEKLEGAIVLDTSVLIDGRLLDIVKTGFLADKIAVPNAVLDEMHLISDSSDDLKRQRGRRGLDMLNDLKKACDVEIFDDEEDTSKEDGVDKELVRLAKKYNMKLMTLDFNLNKVAKAKNVEVLNINELAHALKASVLPGESLEIKIVAKGKENNQGVGYLDDGTMVVVKGADDKKGKKVKVEVTRIIQTDAGQMVFGEL